MKPRPPNTIREILIRDVYKKTGKSKPICKKVFESFLGVITEKLLDYDTVQLRDYFTFSTKERKERMARNPRDGTPHPLPKRLAALCSFSPKIKDRITNEF